MLSFLSGLQLISRFERSRPVIFRGKKHTIVSVDMSVAGVTESCVGIASGIIPTGCRHLQVDEDNLRQLGDSLPVDIEISTSRTESLEQTAVHRIYKFKSFTF